MSNVPAGHPRLWAHFVSVLLKSALCLKLLDKARAPLLSLPPSHALALVPDGRRRHPSPEAPAEAPFNEPRCPFPFLVRTTVIPKHPILQHSQWVCRVQLREVTKQRAGCPESYTVLVTDIPPGPEGIPSVAEKFGAIWGGDFAVSTPVVQTGELDKLVKRRDELRGLLETAQWRLEHPPGGKEGKRAPGGERWRPTHRTGPLGLFGPEVDSLDEYSRELDAVEARCTAVRRAVLSGTSPADAPVCGAAFVAFYSVREAVLAAQVQHTEDPFAWRVQPAPPPEDVFWPNLGRLGFFQLRTAQSASAAAVWGIVLFWMVPVTFVQSLATLSHLARLLPFLEPAFENQTVKSIIEVLRARPHSRSPSLRPHTLPAPSHPASPAGPPPPSAAGRRASSPASSSPSSWRSSRRSCARSPSSRGSTRARRSPPRSSGSSSSSAP